MTDGNMDLIDATVHGRNEDRPQKMDLRHPRGIRHSTLTKKGVLKFYFDRNPNYSTLFNMGRTRIVAEAIFKAIKSINKKYKKKYLKGRTIPGINSEISWHYRAYNLRIVVNHANPADLGSTDKKNSGYDSNAWIFEPKINWGDEKL